MRREAALPLSRTFIVAALLLALLVGCGAGERGLAERDDTGQSTPEESDAGRPPREAVGGAPPAPEPAEAPPLAEEPEGRVVEVGHSPEGLAADPETGLVVVGLSDPDELAMVDGGTGEVVRRARLPESPRHLRLAAPGGPVLVPAERADALVQVGLPGGEVVSRTPVGAFPHDAAASPDGRRVFVVNEMESTASVIEAGRVIGTLETPLQPGGVAVADGMVGVVGVRGLALRFYDARTLRSPGKLDAGEGPTHVVAGPDGRFYVADTRGGAVLVYDAKPEPEMISRLDLGRGSPYGISVDPERNHLWVTLTAENRVVQYDVSEPEPRELARYPTVRQPNSVAVDPKSGRVFVAGTTNGELQILAPR